MTVFVNGELCELGAESTVADVVRALVESAERGVAVALDGAIVPRSAWTTTKLRDGVRVEVLRAVQGGGGSAAASGAHA
jgi:sulfur carrier protein